MQVELDSLKDLIGLREISGIVLAISMTVALAINVFLVDVDDRSFPAQAEVKVPSNDTGLGVVTDPELDFGEVPQNASVRKRINVSSDQNLMIKTGSNGNISSKLDHERTQYIESNGQVEIEFESSEVGYFEGDVILSIYTTDVSYMDRWLKLRSDIGY